jgi:F-type H+-transporting ATPase subunit delta
MSGVKSSKRYAQAVFQIAIENNNLEIWQQNLTAIAELMSQTDFASLLDNPKVPFIIKAEIARNTLGEIDPLALNFAFLLISKNKSSQADQIKDEFHNLVNEYQGIKYTEITTAISVDERDKEKLKQRLETIIGSKISIRYSVDPTILGGIIARFNGSLLDGSVRNNLEMLRKSLVGVGNKFP